MADTMTPVPSSMDRMALATPHDHDPRADAPCAGLAPGPGVGMSCCYLGMTADLSADPWPRVSVHPIVWVARHRLGSAWSDAIDPPPPRA
jgi:hypothetical protein